MAKRIRLSTEGSDEGQGSDKQNLPPKDVLRRVSLDVARYALSCEEARIIIKREFILKEIISPSSHMVRESKIFHIVYEQAQAILRSRFGMEMVALPSRVVPDEIRGLNRKKDINNLKSPQSFILRNILSDELKAVSSDLIGTHEKTYMGLVFIVVSIIASKGGLITRSSLEVDYLSKLNLLDTIWGNPSSYLSRMVKQQYLVQTNVQEENREPRPYIWLGSRARVEFQGEGMFIMIKEIMGSDFNESRLRHALEKSLLIYSSVDAASNDEMNSRARHEVEGQDGEVQDGEGQNVEGHDVEGHDVEGYDSE